MRDEATGQLWLQKNHRTILQDHLDPMLVMLVAPKNPSPECRSQPWSPRPPPSPRPGRSAPATWTTIKLPQLTDLGVRVHPVEVGEDGQLEVDHGGLLADQELPLLPHHGSHSDGHEHCDGSSNTVCTQFERTEVFQSL